ncbi:hypothetical protein BC828DRAFT_215417 [Blastocladiella britannica]|nr:hypothetical protein BC828DRAFT_215417 [Blastocladiella britannica]
MLDRTDDGRDWYSLESTGFSRKHGATEIFFRIPSSDLTRTATTTAYERQSLIRAVQQRVETLKTTYADRMQSMHAEFHVNRTGAPSVSLVEAAQWVFNDTSAQITAAHYMALASHVMADTVHFIPTSASLYDRQSILFRPQQSVELLAQAKPLVAASVAQSKNRAVPATTVAGSPLASFVAKCKRLLDHRNPVEPWSESDGVFLECVREVALGPRGSTAPFEWVGDHVLAPLGFASVTRFPDPSRNLLVALGVYHRLDNFPVLASPQLQLEGHGDTGADTRAAVASRAARGVAETRTVVDGLESVRDEVHEPVYTIDDPSAHEIDDGVSVEMNGDGVVEWVHVHVADPTAYLTRDSALAAWAQTRMQTVYFPETSYAMLPSPLGSQVMSLAMIPDDLGRGDIPAVVRALTVSFRPGSDGNFTDAKVRPTVLKSVIPRPYDLVDTVLDRANVPGVYSSSIAPLRVLSCDPARDRLHAAQSMSESPSTLSEWPGGPVTDRHACELRALQSVAVRHARFRQRQGGFTFPSTSVQVSVQNDPLSSWTPTPRGNAVPHRRLLLPGSTTTHTSPPAGAADGIDVTIHRDLMVFSPARAMVAELMIMAGRAAAALACDMRVAVPYRTQPAPDSTSLAALPTPIADLINPATMMLSTADLNEVMAVMKGAENSAVPGPHFQMGIRAEDGGYAKITSPLRRAGDMLAHYQLKAALFPSGGEPLPAAEVAQWLAPLRAREREIKRVQRQREEWWAIECVGRRLRSAADAASTSATAGTTYMARIGRALDRPPPGIAPTDPALAREGVVAAATLLDAGVRATVWVPDVVGAGRRASDWVRPGAWAEVRVTGVDPVSGWVQGEVVRCLWQLDARAE